MNLSIKILIIIMLTNLNFKFLDKNISYKYSEENYLKINDKSCSFCHSDKIKFTEIHAATQDACENCHQPTGNKHPRNNLKGFTLADEMPQLCYNCHGSKTDKKYVHTQSKNKGCISCHSPHGADNKKLLINKTKTNYCKNCHNLKINTNDIVHAPAENGSCSDCHDPHQSDNKNLLTQTKPILCFTCHSDTESLKNKKHIHPPFDDDCNNCHTTHKSEHKGLLVEKPPQLCYSCHNNIVTEITDLKYNHSPVNNTKKCENCHNSHASDNEKMLVADEKTLCLSCHDKEISAGEKTISNIKQNLDENQYIHSAITAENCVVCHKPHASEHNSLLKQNYPESDYVKAIPENFALCFNCHDSGLLTEKFTNSATNFRDGNQNMHFLHINGEKGRNCNLCHDAHAAENKFIIKNILKFGNWDMPMNYRITENGGSCGNGCHSEKKYDRINPVRIIFKPDSLKTQTNTEPGTDSLKNIEITDNSNNSQNISNQTENNKKDTTKNTPISVENAVKPDTIKSIKPDSTVIPEIQNINENKISLTEEFKKLGDTKIYFVFGKTQITAQSEKTLKNIIGLLKKYPQSIITIQGYTDNIGDYNYNLNLSKERAKHVKQIFISSGILSQRCKLEIYGEDNPLESNGTEEGRAQNRRVEFKIEEQTK